MMPTLLFAFGTLAPEGRGSAARVGWVADRVRGRLFNLGRSPAPIDCGDAEAGWVAGSVQSGATN